MKWTSIGIIEHTLHRYLLNTIYSPWTFGGPGNVWKGFNVTLLLYNASSFKLFMHAEPKVSVFNAVLMCHFHDGPASQLDMIWSSSGPPSLQRPKMPDWALEFRSLAKQCIFGASIYYLAQLTYKIQVEMTDWYGNSIPIRVSTYKYIEGFGSGLIT